MQEISVSELKKKIANKETMLVSFSASWCGPCKMLKEELKKVSSTTPIYKIDVEEDIDFLECNKRYHDTQNVHDLLIKADKVSIEFAKLWRTNVEKQKKEPVA